MIKIISSYKKVFKADRMGGTNRWYCWNDLFLVSFIWTGRFQNDADWSSCNLFHCESWSDLGFLSTLTWFGLDFLTSQFDPAQIHKSETSWSLVQTKLKHVELIYRVKALGFLNSLDLEEGKQIRGDLGLSGVKTLYEQSIFDKTVN